MSDSELTPPHDEQVRRLLAEARHDGPVPADVAARLDAVLADLSRDAGAEPASPAPVVDLAARRRRRNAGLLLAGAAAVIVGGFGIGQVIDVGGGADDNTATSGSTVTDRDRPEAAAGGDSGSAEMQDDGAANSLRALKGVAPLRLSSSNLAADLDAQLADREADAAAQSPAPPAFQDYARDTGCALEPPATYGDGELFPAYYDGIAAVLALRPPTGETQRADVLECGTADGLASVTLPRR